MKKIVLLISVILQHFIGLAQPNVVWSKSYPDSTFGAVISDAITDNAGNIIIAGARPYDNFINSIEPVVLKYDPSGNIILFWTHSDSLLDERTTQIVCDSLNQLYLLTLVYGTSQATVHLIKIDGVTGQELFNYPLGTGIYAGAIGINHQHLYVALGLPNLVLFKYDLQGNLIWNKPIPQIQRVKQFHFFNEDIYLIGDTIASPNFVDLIQKFDSTGVLQWQTATLSAGSYNYTDSEIDGLSNLWLSGYTTTNSAAYLTKIDSTGIVWDTLLAQNTRPSKISVNNQNEIFWAYIKSTMSGNFCEVLKKNNAGTNLFANIDTAGNTAGVSPAIHNLDINSLSNGNLIIANTRRVTQMLNDYEITSFSANGNFNWSIIYSHTSNSIEKVFRLFAGSSFAYLVGEIKDSVTGAAQINVLRIDFPTAIHELNASDNEFNIYPNPVNYDQINFNVHLNNVYISIYDCSGKIIQKKDRFSGSSLILQENLKPGVYFLMIQNDSILMNMKFIKE